MVLSSVDMKRSQRLSKQGQLRMSDDLKARIDKYKNQVKTLTGVTISHAEAARALIEKGLREERL